METDEMNGQSSQFGFPPPFHGDIATAKNLGITHMVLGNMADQYNTGVVDPSTEIADVDSRKRPLDASSDIRQPFKRSNFGDVDSYRTNTTNRGMLLQLEF
ncbi:hypothetical protein AC249_AIPGENE7969 [Exaiptasia diaphana]|nr:hypothetical protein AC249_AIPGENE17193 [Exaiptasia diaphana]KXJ06043.1 hypothetical protein AC249_AIPGENE7969 [Exaiptasia diaphana]